MTQRNRCVGQLVALRRLRNMEKVSRSVAYAKEVAGRSRAETALHRSEGEYLVLASQEIRMRSDRRALDASQYMHLLSATASAREKMRECEGALSRSEEGCRRAIDELVEARSRLRVVGNALDDARAQLRAMRNAQECVDTYDQYSRRYAFCYVEEV